MRVKLFFFFNVQIIIRVQQHFQLNPTPAHTMGGAPGDPKCYRRFLHWGLNLGCITDFFLQPLASHLEQCLQILESNVRHGEQSQYRHLG